MTTLLWLFLQILKRFDMQKNSKYKSRFAPNRIEYVVYGNPVEAARMLENYGYEAPKDDKELAMAVKELVRKKGRKVIKDLILIHPDRNIILKLNKEKEDSYCGVCSNYSYNQEDNYCGICGHSNYTGDLDVGSYIKQLLDMTTDELEGYYQDILKQSNEKPKDTGLTEELHLIWNELRKRKVSETGEDNPNEKSERKKDSDPVGGLIFIGATLEIGRASCRERV